MLHDPKREVMAKARLILLDAANYIEEHGWCQHALHLNGRVCLFGAINAACCGDAGRYDGLSGEVVHLLRKASGTANLAAWNDAAGRTKEQVVKFLRKAAEA